MNNKAQTIIELAQPYPSIAPSEQEIVDVLVEHYGQPRETIIGWLLNMDELLLKVAV